MLGAGYVSAPVIEYLNRDKNVAVTVGECPRSLLHTLRICRTFDADDVFTASSLKDEADKLAGKYPGVKPVILDVMSRPDNLRDLVEEADVVVSLLPYGLHHVVAEACIDTKTNMVTASYCTPAMQALHERYANTKSDLRQCFSYTNNSYGWFSNYFFVALALWRPASPW